MTDPAGPGPGSSALRVRSVLMVVVGLGLGALAVWQATRGDGGGALADAWRAARTAPAWLQAAALALPAANWCITSGIFLILTRAHGRVGAGEMAALIGAAGLYNYLPLRPGLVGRIAYHRAVNGIPIMASVRVLATTIALSVVGIALLLVSSLAAARIGSPVGKALALSVPPATASLVAWYAFSRGLLSWRLAAGLALRGIDLLAWTARYLVVFSLIGRPIDLSQAAAIAGVSQVVSAIPLAGNGLGLREWAVAWVATALPAWYAGGPAAPGTDVGLSADLLNRGAELPAAVLVGLVSTVVLARRMASVSAGRTVNPDSEPGP